MTTQASSSTPSNYVADAAVALGNRCIHITSDGHPNHTHVRLSDGTSLGLVQKVTYTLGVGELARCSIETAATPAELIALTKNTTVIIKPSGNPLKWMWVYYIAKLRGFCRDTRYLSMFRR